MSGFFTEGYYRKVPSHSAHINAPRLQLQHVVSSFAVFGITLFTFWSPHLGSARKDLSEAPWMPSRFFDFIMLTIILAFPGG